MSSYKELLAKREELEQAIAEARKIELSEAIGKAKALISDFGLTQMDLFDSEKSAKTAKVRADGTEKTGRQKVAPKYKDPITGATWTGRGKAPKWIDGQDRTRFVI
jgi:DNA-binding protein H-NS